MKLCTTNLVTTYVLRVDTKVESLDSSFKEFGELESLGIQPDEKSLCYSTLVLPSSRTEDTKFRCLGSSFIHYFP